MQTQKATNKAKPTTPVSTNTCKYKLCAETY